MNWNSVAFDWNQARAFLATVEEGSLSAAARKLGLTQPTLGRHVAALEADLDVVLFEHVGRSLILTPSGLELVDHVKAMFDAAARVSLTASGQSQAVEGKVCITAADVMSAHILPAALVQLRKIAPRLEIEVLATNDIRDLQLREADIAIRHVQPDQPNLIAKLIGEGSAHFYASKAYLDKHGRPACKSDLCKHDFVGFGDNETLIATLNQMGLALTPENFRVGSASGLVAWEIARGGLGITITMDKVGDAYDDMERVLPEIGPMLFPIWLTVHKEIHTSRRIRVVYDLLSYYLKKHAI